MSKSIKTYEDLLLEEQRLEAQIESYKVLISEDLTALKASLNPFKRVMEKVRMGFTRGENNPLMNFGLNFSIDLILRRFILGRANWIIRFAIPYLVKNYASHLVSEEDRTKITKSIKRWLKSLKSQKDKPEAYHSATV